MRRWGLLVVLAGACGPGEVTVEVRGAEDAFRPAVGTPPDEACAVEVSHLTLTLAATLEAPGGRSSVSVPAFEVVLPAPDPARSRPMAVTPAWFEAVTLALGRVAMAGDLTCGADVRTFAWSFDPTGASLRCEGPLLGVATSGALVVDVVVDSSVAWSDEERVVLSPWWAADGAADGVPDGVVSLDELSATSLAAAGLPSGGQQQSLADRLVVRAVQALSVAGATCAAAAP